MNPTDLRIQDPKTRTYLGSPSLVRAPDGALVATHDYFGAGCPRNHEREEHLTSVYRSEDGGRSWRSVTHLSNAYWGTLFTHMGALYHLGVSQQYGSIVIRRSDDGGHTWTHPADEKSGWLFTGGVYHADPNYHGAPVPVLVHGGRLYRAFENCLGTVWGEGFASFMISADENADLLLASSWTKSNEVRFPASVAPAGTKIIRDWGWLEGNAVAAPDGSMWNLLRLHSWMPGKAALLSLSPDGNELRFDASSGFIDFPGHHAKFTVRRDPATGAYLSLVNATPTDPRYAGRNALSLSASADLRHWTVVHEMLRDDLGLSPEESLKRTGFQYVDWQFDGEDLIYLVRAAYDGAPNFHDSNRIRFYRLEKFRSLLASAGLPRGS
ncbi:MAG: exo-alpha-sialidase [Spirochaetes bacterium]|nr:exo-alpha-sialidase [Spirochaetota bacterium]